MSTWIKFKKYFDVMSDNDVAEETRYAEAQRADADEWLEAVASWEAAGRPRTPRDTTPPAAQSEGGAGHE